MTSERLHAALEAGTWDLHWSIKDSFLAYFHALPERKIELFDDASLEEQTGCLVFPFAGQQATSDGAVTRIEFSGDVRLQAHGGMLLVILMKPWIEISGNNIALSFVDLMAWPDTSRREIIGTLIDEIIEVSDNVLEIPVKLTTNAVEIFNNVYPAGTAMAPVRLISQISV